MARNIFDNIAADLIADACVPAAACQDDCAAECEPTCARCGVPIPVDALCCRECGEDVRWDLEVASW